MKKLHIVLDTRVRRMRRALKFECWKWIWLHVYVATYARFELFETEEEQVKGGTLKDRPML